MSLFERFSNLFQKLRPEREDREGKSQADFKGGWKSFFNPVSAVEIRRLQFFWAGCIVAIVFIFAYGVMSLFIQKEGIQHVPKLLSPKTMETAISKANVNEAYWHKAEEENKKLHAEIKAIEALFLEGAKSQEALEQNDSQHNRVEELEAKLESLQTQIEEQQKMVSLPPQAISTSGGYANDPYTSEGQGRNSQITKFSLGLRNSYEHKQRNSVDTRIPAGAFAQTILLSGLDASSAMNASSDPRPMLLRLIDHGTLPRKFQSDLKDCHCTASAYGDLSSERVYARLEKLTCIERSTGDIIETQVAGYIAGADGKAGIRGVVASKDGEFLSRSLVGGVFAGLSNVANPQNRQAQVNPFFPGSAQVSPPSIGGMFASGMATGATTALDRLSQYYIDRAEQLQPVIQIAAGQVVDIVFTEGTYIGSQTIKSDIEKTREMARNAQEVSSFSKDSPPSPSVIQVGE